MIEGIFTHFSKADETDKAFTKKQEVAYEQMITWLKERQVSIPIHHVSNSAGIVDLPSYQDRFRYIMVDEYQDTNTAQFELIRLLALKYQNLCVVGDDDQSIYKFRGANIYNILNFEHHFPDATVIKLEQNYRSTQNILDAANAVIANNQGRKEKRLWTDNGAGDKITFEQLDTAAEEADFVARDIARAGTQRRVSV